jgi:hypothetical protein
MGQDRDVYIPLGDRIADPWSLSGTIPDEACDVLTEYHYGLQGLAMRNLRMKTPLRLNLAHKPRILAGRTNPSMHPALPLYEVPYLVTTGILNKDIPADPQLGEKESYYRELVGLSLVRVLEVMEGARVNAIGWTSVKERFLPNGRECYEVSATRSEELLKMAYVPSRRVLQVDWYDQNPTIPALEKPIGFRSLRASIRVDSEVFSDSSRPNELRMDFEVSELIWRQQRDRTSRVAGSRNLTHDLLGLNKHHVPVATGDQISCLIATDSLLKFLNVGFLRPAERRQRPTDPSLPLS